MSIFSEAMSTHLLATWDLGIQDLYPSIKGVARADYHLPYNPIWTDIKYHGTNRQNPLQQSIRDTKVIALSRSVSPQEILRLRRVRYHSDPIVAERCRQNARRTLARIKADPVLSKAQSEKKSVARLKRKALDPEMDKRAYDKKVAKDPEGSKVKKNAHYQENKAQICAKAKGNYEQNGERIRANAKWRYDNDAEYRAKKIAQVAATAAKKKKEREEAKSGTSGVSDAGGTSIFLINTHRTRAEEEESQEVGVLGLFGAGVGFRVGQSVLSVVTVQ